MIAVLPLDVALMVALVWLVLGAIGFVFKPCGAAALSAYFLASALGALLMAAAGLWALHVPASVLVLPFGLPDLPFHLRLDALSGFFLVLIGLIAFGVALFSAGYFKGFGAEPMGRIGSGYHVFLAAMALVVLADDAYSFLVAWETMAIASYFLVVTEHHVEQNRRAGFLYLFMAHVGAVAILLCFGILHGGAGDYQSYTFAAMRVAQLDGYSASFAFGLALFGFGAKAGMVPLHVWLPEAHPAAPSPVSALMSGVMLKTAIYGMVRVMFDLIGDVQWQWGMVVLVLGSITSLFGVLFALMQHDLKRLLAYHSVENIGIILIGLGLSMIFVGGGQPLIGALGLIAALYHTLNHAVFKGLLFLGTGAINRATGQRNLNEFGGLIHRMPRTAAYFLVGALAISALPPLNGFVSEWLTFQAALAAPVLKGSVARSLIPIAAATLALSGALTAMCFVKVFGVTFLGRPRRADLTEVREAGLWEQAGMGWLAAGCIALGLFPVFVVGLLNKVCVTLIGSGLEQGALDTGMLWLAPITPERASYSPLIFLSVVVSVVLVTYYLVRMVFH
ncbi:MAG: hydrogenase 4 subunit B, partial [Burkholderiales bacterium]